MNHPQCPVCDGVIETGDVNVGTDVAFCRNCNIAHQFSDLVDPDLDAGVDLSRPESGTWYRPTFQGREIGVSHRSIPGALGSLAAALFWNGIVSVFVVLALSGTANVMGISAPEWFPDPVMKDQTMGIGMVIFLWIFLTPFILIGMFFVISVFQCLWGKTTIVIERDKGVLFTGLGSIGWKRRFDVREIKNVRLHRYDSSDSAAETVRILLKNGKELKFGSTLTNQKRIFLGSALRQTIRSARV